MLKIYFEKNISEKINDFHEIPFWFRRESGELKLNDPPLVNDPPYFRFSESDIWEIWKSDMFRLPAAGGENFAVLRSRKRDF